MRKHRWAFHTATPPYLHGKKWRLYFRNTSATRVHYAYVGLVTPWKAFYVIRFHKPTTYYRGN